MTHGRYRNEPPEVAELPHRCDHGWLDRNADHPRPCLICKPWLEELRPRHVDVRPESARSKP